MTTTRKAEHLKVDPPVVIQCTEPEFRQNYVLISFLSPEDRIKQRFIYEANQFLYHDVNKQIVDTTTNVVRSINTDFQRQVEKKIASYQSSQDPVYRATAELLNDVIKDMKLNEDNHVQKVLRTYRIDQEDLTDRFEVYKTQNAKELEAIFNQKFTDEGSIRGYKVRGVYENYEDARKRAEFIHKEVESVVHTFIGRVGYWTPWDPNADAVQDQETMIDDLNKLMAQKKLNEKERDDFFQKRKQMMIDNAEQERTSQLKKQLHERVKSKEDQRKKK